MISIKFKWLSGNVIKGNPTHIQTAGFQSKFFKAMNIKQYLDFKIKYLVVIQFHGNTNT